MDQTQAVYAAEDLWGKKDSMSGDYDHLLQTAMRWVDVS